MKRVKKLKTKVFVLCLLTMFFSNLAISTEYFLDGKFSSLYPNHKANSLHFVVNPTDGPGTASEIISVFRNACNAWNSISNHTGIILTVSGPDTTTSTSEWAKDGESVLYFAYRASGDAQAYPWDNESNDEIVEGDIWCNSNTDWSLDDSPEEYEYDLWAVLVHELGHLFGLNHCSETYEDFVMDSDVNGRGLIGPRYPGGGDKAGAVYQSCNASFASGIIPFTTVFSATENLEINDDLEVSAGDTLLIADHVYLDFDGGSITTSSGIIILQDGGSENLICKCDGGGNIKGIYGSFTDAKNDLSAGESVYLPHGLLITNGESYSIPSNTYVKVASGEDITIQSGGTLSIASGVTINGMPGDTCEGIDNNGTLNITGGITIRNAIIALKLNNSTANFPNTVSYIDSCGYNGQHDCAVYVTSTPTVKYLYIKNSAQSTNFKAIKVATISASPFFQYLTIEDSYHAFRIGQTADAIMDYSIISDIIDDCIVLESGGSSSGTIDTGWSSNDIIPGAGDKAINNDNPIDSMNVNDTYWGASPDTTSLFSYTYGFISYSPFAASPFNIGANKIVPKEPGPFRKGMQFELAGQTDKALDIYYDIISSDPNVAHKRMAIKSICRVNEINNRDFGFLRSVISDEMETDVIGYRYVLDYLYCNTFFIEGRYDEAIQAFTGKINSYDDNSIKVEMLAKIASIYGNRLNNLERAKEYADMAASINPGQDILSEAYRAAGIFYDPSEYSDVFQNTGDNTFDGSENVIKPAETRTIPEITLFPNPANPRTTILYTLHEPSRVEIDIYSITGQKIYTLVEKYHAAGTHSVVFNGSNLASGLYLYHFRTRDFQKSGKILLVK